MDRKLGKNIVLNVGYNLLSVVVPFLTAPYLGRVLGSKNIGDYTFVFSIATYFVMFGMLGTSNYGTKEIAKVRNSKEKRSAVFWEIFYMQFFTGGLAFLLYTIYIYRFVVYNIEYFLIMSLYVLSCLLDSAWYCSGTERFTSIVLRNAIIKLLNLFFIFSFVRVQTDIYLYFVIMSVCYLLSPVSLWPTIIRDVNYIKPKHVNIIKHLKNSLILFVPTIAASIYQIMDKVMIGSISDSIQLAYYEYADKIINISNIVFGSMGAVMLSRMSNILTTKKEDVSEMISFSVDLSFLFSIGFAFGIMAISDELVQVYYGMSFTNCGPILKILSPVVLFYGFNSVVRMQYLIPNGMNSIYIVSTLIGASANILLNMVFIPRFGAVGAAVGTFLTQVSISSYYIFKTNKVLKVDMIIKRNAGVFLSGFVMFGVIKVLQSQHTYSSFGLLLDFFVGFLVYLIINFTFYKSFKVKHLLHSIMKKWR